MTYRFVDRMEDFEFHDSFWTLVSWEDDRAVFEITQLNVHKTVLPEPPDTDMEIKAARMTLYGFADLTAETGNGRPTAKRCR